MPGVLIINPVTEGAQITAPGSGADNLLTPSPREIWLAPGTGAQAIDIDLKAVTNVDCFYLGATNARAAATWSVQSIGAIGGAVTATHFAGAAMRLPGAIRSRYAAFARLPAPVSGRYFRITVTQGAAPSLEIGNLVMGLAIDWPYTFGPGRTPVDTSRVVQLVDGGFGVDRGVVKTMFQWRFADLDQATLSKLWAVVEDRGESRPLVVVEGPDYPPEDPSVHYCIFRRFEPYEREDPAETKWAFTVEEWR